MNREIKFRGQKVDTKEWIYGFYAKEPFINKYGTLHIRDVRPTIDGIYVIPETVGQYTGLKDKYGKEIYEGDICRCLDTDENEYLSAIKFERGAFIVDVNQCEYDYSVLDWALEGDILEIEVIGNIYENPELLEKIE